VSHPPRSRNGSSTNRGASAVGAVLFAICLLAVGGCGEPELENYYGRRQLPLVGASVNGTDVLAAMFAEAGHTVAVRRALITSGMESVDTIVWFPDDFAAPSSEVCQWFDEWLVGRSGRKLVYVGRDFDAAPLYWKKATPLVAPSEQAEYRKREQEAVATARPWSRPKAEELDCEWFKIAAIELKQPHELAGPWSQGVEAPKTEIELTSLIVPHGEEEPLLTSGGEVIVARQRQPHWHESQLLTVANGSFLLNLPLVNHEHRKLAGKLIEGLGPAGRVVFLESGRGGPPVDPPATDSSLWRVFGAWPLNAILLHFAVLGIIFCFARWPIFGRPQTPPAETTADFGKHVDAVGQLLRRTKDRNYALARLPATEEPRAGDVLASRNTPRHIVADDQSTR
jgi:hypothetical protein